MFLAPRWLQAASLLTLLPTTHPFPLTSSPPAILILPSSNSTALSTLIPFNETTTTTTTNTTTTPSYENFPPTPFILPIPLLEPPQTLKVLKTYRQGLSTEKYALLDLIAEQIEWYDDNPSPPKPFTLTSFPVRFSMRTAIPHKPDQDHLTRAVAVGALQVFYALVEEFGAVECDFVVEGREGGVGAGFWVRFL